MNILSHGVELNIFFIIQSNNFRDNTTLDGVEVEKSNHDDESQDAGHNNVQREKDQIGYHQTTNLKK